MATFSMLPKISIVILSKELTFALNPASLAILDMSSAIASELPVCVPNKISKFIRFLLCS